MVAYNYEQILGQRVSFAPAADIIRFDTLSAASLSFTTSGVALLATSALGTATFDATPLLEDTTLGLFTLANALFAGGSVLAVGDLSADPDADANANVIDFTTNTALTGALNNANFVHGLGGDDTLVMTGATGNNVMYGGSGGDDIVAGSGNNTIYGGNGAADTSDGADSITVGGGSNIIYANAGADTVVFSAPPAAGQLLQFFGGTGGDSITAAAAQGRFMVNAGPDADLVSLTGGSGNNTIYGGLGGDTVNVSGSLGDHTIYGGTGIVDTADGGDSITLGQGNSIVYANAGADTVVASATVGKHTTIYLGSGGDVLTSASAHGEYLIFGGSGSDAIDLTNHYGSATVYGGSGGNDSGDGGDTIVASSGGNSVIYGNGGADKITVRPGANESALVYAGAGNDTITATPGDTSASLTLYGNGGNNQFVLDFSSASPIVRIQDYGNGTNSLLVTLGGGASAADLTITHTDGGGTLLRNGAAEQIVLEGFVGRFTSTTFGTSDGSVFLTNFNNSAATLTGTDHDDYLIAGQNGDTLAAGAGDDRLQGGGGADRFSFASANFGAGDVVRGASGTDTLNIGTPGTAVSDAAFLQVSQVEVLRLESGDFSVNGITLGTLATAAGIRTVDAAAASKAGVNLSAMTAGVTYTGGSGEDVLVSTNHADSISAGGGDDVIMGGSGADTMTGGAGEDTFVYSAVSDIGDTLTDFDFATATTTTDVLRISAGGAGFNLGNQDAVVDGAIISSLVSAGAVGTELIILNTIGIAQTNIDSALDTVNADVNSARGVLNVFFDTTASRAVMYYDTNGNAAGGHVLVATFDNVTTLAGMNNINFTDFEFVV